MWVGNTIVTLWLLYVFSYALKAKATIACKWKKVNENWEIRNKERTSIVGRRERGQRQLRGI